MSYKGLRLGEAGEEMAARYLAEKGLTIHERRVRFPNGELDIVAKDGKEWVFVEVKTRSSTAFGSAGEAMGWRKTKKMEQAVDAYICKHNLDNALMRCDLVTIDLSSDGTARIEHFPSAITF